MASLFKRDHLILAAITLLAAFLRFYHLDSIPPGFQFDQAFNAFDFFRLLQGQFAIFFPANTGREPLYFYLSIVSAALFGQTAFAVKLTSAVVGVVTIPLLYFFARSFFHSRSIALLASFFAAISIWHIFFSRDGLRVILQVPLTLFVFWYLWRALTPQVREGWNPPSKYEWNRAQAWEAWLQLGLFLALALYTYPSARLLPIAIIFLAAYTVYGDPSRARDIGCGMIVALVVAALIFAPLGIYFLTHPDEFIAHTESISVFDPRVNEGSIVGAIWKNLLGILGMFFIRGDGSSIHNLPYRPIFDPFIGALFLVGVAVLFVALVRSNDSRINHLRALFLVTWIGISLASSLFSDDAPNFLRILPALPPVMIVPAWGAQAIWVRLTGSVARRTATTAFAVLMAFSTGWSYRDYFETFANLPELYYTFDVDKVEVANWINANEKSKKIFLAPLWYQQGTISLLTHNARLKTFDSRDTIVLPSRADNQDALYGFPPEQAQRLETMATRLGSIGVKESIRGSNNVPPMLLYRVPAQNLPDPGNPLTALTQGGTFVQPQTAERSVWADQMALVGSTYSPQGPGGRNLTVILFLHALKQLDTDYTFSVKVLDEKKRVWGQEDKWPGDNSYETSHWDVGDLVIERFYPGLMACAPAGDYHITVEAYDPKSGVVLALSDRNGNAVALGNLRAGGSQGNLYENLEPGQAKELRLSDHLQLFGYTLTPDSARSGEIFSLSLFWRGVGSGSAEKISIKLGDVTLIEPTIQIPPEGRGICSFYDLAVPASIASGKIPLRVNDQPITQMNVSR